MTENKLYVYILTAVGTLGAVVMRIVQNMLMIESSTGFFREGYETANILIIAGVFVIIGVVTVLAAICKEKPSAPPQKTRLFAVLHYVLAATIVLETLLTEVSAVTPGWQIIAHLILTMVAAVILFLSGTFTLLNLKDRPMMYITLVLLWMLKLIIIFANYTSLSTITENIFELGAICGILIYFLSYSKLMAGVNTSKVLSKFLGVSVLSFMLCGIYALPQLFMCISGNRALIHSKNATFITAIVMMVFIAFSVYLCFKGQKSAVQTKRETTEE